MTPIGWTVMYIAANGVELDRLQTKAEADAVKAALAKVNIASVVSPVVDIVFDDEFVDGELPF